MKIKLKSPIKSVNEFSKKQFLEIKKLYIEKKNICIKIEAKKNHFEKIAYIKYKIVYEIRKMNE